MVNSAIEFAQQATMKRLQTIDMDSQNNELSEFKWQHVKKRSKQRNKNVVMGNASFSSGVKTVPKLSYLHVSRLHPTTKPDDLKNLLFKSFPEVEVEPLQSKHPQIYSSMKVAIYQEHFKDAWRKEIWPQGSLVSKYFLFKKKAPPVEVGAPQERRD